MFSKLKQIKLIKKLEGHTSDVTSVDFFDDRLASCSSDKTVQLWFRNWDGEFSQPLYSPLVGHTYGVNCVRFSPFGTILASCSTDGKVILWDTTNGQKVSEIQHTSNSPIRVCAFSPISNLFATGGDDEKVILWDLSTKTTISIFTGHTAMVTALAFSPDGLYLISCSTAGDLLLWDGRFGHGKYLHSISNAHDLGVLGCDFSPQYDASAERGFLSGNYTAATCGNDDLIKLWFIKAGAEKDISLIHELRGHSGNVMSCRFSSDGTWLASTGGDKNTILWNPSTGEPLLKLDGHERYVTCCAFLSASVLATGSNDKNVFIYSLESNNLINICSDLEITSERHSLAHWNPQGVMAWTVKDVCKWLKKNNMRDLVKTFIDNDIDGRELTHLTHESLMNNLKVESYGKRNKLLRGIQSLKNPSWHHAYFDMNDEMALEEFYCPITHEIMINPVIAADGYSYEKTAIEEWLQSGKTSSPMTNQELAHTDLTPNHVLFQLIQKYK